jgi:hypothetical protein
MAKAGVCAPNPSKRITCSALDVCTFRWTRRAECDLSYVSNLFFSQYTNCHAIKSSHLSECSWYKVPSSVRVVLCELFVARAPPVTRAGGHLATENWRTSHGISITVLWLLLLVQLLLGIL